jgi:uncharacterized protein (TIGR02246 family)
MSLRRVCVVSALALSLAACARSAGAPAPAPDAATVAAEIGAVLDSTAAGWNRGDLSRYLWAYAESTTVMGRGGVEHGIEAIRQQMLAFFWKTGRPLQVLRYEHLSVRLLGPESALATGQYILSGNGLPDRTGWFTTVWARTTVGWRMIHDHS